MAIHPASRGVAAHTAGLFRSEGWCGITPVEASQAREFSLFLPVEASPAKNFHFPPPRGGSPS